jgi:lysophospholipase L1-like esterase
MQFQLKLICLLSLVAISSNAAEVHFSPENIQIRSTFSTALEKGQKGGVIRVASLGGSITENKTGHSAMVPKLLAELLPKAKISAINAGLSSTCSTSGAFRLDDHVLSQGPLDLLVVEFAVNDDQDAGHSRRDSLRGMEGIIRHVREASPKTEIVIVYFLNEGMMRMLQAGQLPVSISAHEEVARHYGVTSVNVAAEVAGAIKTGDYTWKDYGGTHPKKFGYQIASKMIVHAIAGGWNRSDLPAKAKDLPAKIDPDSYTAGRFVATGASELNGKWQQGKVGRELLPIGAIRSRYNSYDLLRGERIGDSMRIEFTGRAIGAFILAGPDAGMVTSRIDGGKEVSHDLFHRFSEKLNYPRSVMFRTGLKPRKHVLELAIAPAPNPKSRGNAANILFFEVN